MSHLCQLNGNNNLAKSETRNPNGNTRRCNLTNRHHVAFHLITVVILIALVTYLLTSKVCDEKNDSDTTTRVCLSCESLSGKTNEERVMLVRKGNQCCTSESEAHKLLATPVSGGHSRIPRRASPLQDSEHDHTISDVRNSRSVAAHLYLNIQNSSLNNTVLWTLSRSHSFITSGLNYSESTGIMTVMQPGIYYIYSQLIFNSALSRYDQLYQQIILKRVNESILMFWKQKVNSTREFLPSSLGGNFKLKENDQIYVSASDPKFLYKMLRANFFGLHYV
ncbi:hypothetical protein ACJMK2_018030 [Sinanodonta woodiana]|uniref:THD domain-containing protein n=1 Tax=Sinanodonta woodiana TaxID=1069815 RepID=A0ABD3UCH9_SINWO